MKTIYARSQSDLSLISGYTINSRVDEGSEDFVNIIPSGETIENGVMSAVTFNTNTNVSARTAYISSSAIFNGKVYTTPEIAIKQHKHPNYYSKGEAFLVNPSTKESGSTLTISTNTTIINLFANAYVNNDSTHPISKSQYFTVSCSGCTELGELVEEDRYVRGMFRITENSTYEERNIVFEVTFNNSNGSTWTETLYVKQKGKEHTYEGPFFEPDFDVIPASGGDFTFSAYYTVDGVKKACSGLTADENVIISNIISIVSHTTISSDVTYNNTVGSSDYCRGTVSIPEDTYETGDGCNDRVFLVILFCSEIRKSKGEDPSYPYTISKNFYQKSKKLGNYEFSITPEIGTMSLLDKDNNIYGYKTHETYESHSYPISIISTKNGLPNTYKYSYTIDGKTLTDETNASMVLIPLSENSGDTRTIQIDFKQNIDAEDSVQTPTLRCIIYQLSKWSQCIFKPNAGMNDFTHAFITTGNDFTTGDYPSGLLSVKSSTLAVNAVGESATTFFKTDSDNGDTDEYTLAWGGHTIEESARNEYFVLAKAIYEAEADDNNSDLVINFYAKADTDENSNGFITANVVLVSEDTLPNVTPRPKYPSVNVYTPGKGYTTIKEYCLHCDLTDDTCKAGFNENYRLCFTITKYASDSKCFITQIAGASHNILVSDYQDEFYPSHSGTCVYESCRLLSPDINSFPTSKVYSLIQYNSKETESEITLSSNNMLIDKLTSEVTASDTISFDSLFYNKTKFRLYAVGINPKTPITDNTNIYQKSDFKAYYDTRSDLMNHTWTIGDTVCLLFDKVNDLAEKQETTTVYTRDAYLRSLSSGITNDYVEIPTAGFQGTFIDPVTKATGTFTVSDVIDETMRYKRTITWEDISEGSKRALKINDSSLSFKYGNYQYYVPLVTTCKPENLKTITNNNCSSLSDYNYYYYMDSVGSIVFNLGHSTNTKNLNLVFHVASIPTKFARSGTGAIYAYVYKLNSSSYPANLLCENCLPDTSLATQLVNVYKVIDYDKDTYINVDLKIGSLVIPQQSDNQVMLLVIQMVSSSGICFTSYYQTPYGNLKNYTTVTYNVTNQMESGYEHTLKRENNGNTMTFTLS